MLKYDPNCGEDKLIPVPEVNLLSQNNNIRSLQDASKKMSKSDPKKLACINLIDDAELIRIKITRAKTDSLGKVI